MLLFNSWSFDIIFVLSHSLISETQALAFFSLNGEAAFLLVFVLRFGEISLTKSLILVVVSFWFIGFLSWAKDLLSKWIDWTYDMMLKFQFFLFVNDKVDIKSKWSYLTLFQLLSLQRMLELGTSISSFLGFPLRRIKTIIQLIS